jgi:hypothetical protein
MSPVQVPELDAIGPQAAKAFLDVAPENVRPAFAGAIAALGGNDARRGRRRAEPRLAPIVCSLSPTVYRWAVSITPTPASAALLMNATFSGVLVSLFVPRPMRLTSRPASWTVRGCTCSD